jgi:hypothetical protein
MTLWAFGELTGFVRYWRLCTSFENDKTYSVVFNLIGLSKHGLESQ